ncbi:hypothetical protein CYMTET_25179 [Cymbomonas tetramitiformis]|uniref:Histone H4 n=1 Tax=Cymbomonas tetramitiformis TaxID=36881 RepID=A0AAE0KZA8_9CHLO|nr:hypothetical protein CYMTET_25179 [Cymbomonas tetramitiformis]
MLGVKNLLQRFSRDPADIVSPSTNTQTPATHNAAGANKPIITPGRGIALANKRRQTPNRRVFRSMVEGISKADLRRCARRGGVKRISPLVYIEARGVLKRWLEDVIKDALTYSQHSRRMVVTTMDVIYALKRRGVTIYGPWNGARLVSKEWHAKRVRKIRGACLRIPTSKAVAATPATPAEALVDARAREDVAARQEACSTGTQAVSSAFRTPLERYNVGATDLSCPAASTRSRSARTAQLDASAHFVTPAAAVGKGNADVDGTDIPLSVDRFQVVKELISSYFEHIYQESRATTAQVIHPFEPC